MLHDASEGRFSDSIVADGSLPPNLLRGPIAVYVWVTLRPNLNLVHNTLFSRRVWDSERPDHACLTLVAEDGWRYSMGFMYSGRPQFEGIWKGLFAEEGHYALALTHALKPMKRAASMLATFTAKVATPDWILKEGLDATLAKRRGEAPVLGKASGLELVAVGELSDPGRSFLRRLVSNKSDISRTGLGFDIKNEALLGRYKSVACGEDLQQNCASFVEHLLPEIVLCKSLLSSVRMPVSCRPALLQQLECIRRNASHTEVHSFRWRPREPDAGEAAEAEATEGAAKRQRR